MRACRDGCQAIEFMFETIFMIKGILFFSGKRGLIRVKLSVNTHLKHAMVVNPKRVALTKEIRFLAYSMITIESRGS